MSFELLVLITVSQLALLLLLLVGMLMARITRIVLGHVHEREVSEATLLIQAWLDGNADDADIEPRIAELSDDTFSTIVRAYSSLIEGGRWEGLVSMLRRTPWFAAMKRRATSPLWWRRLDSARALGLLAREEEVELVGQLIGDRHHAVRLAAVRILKRVPDEQLLRDIFEQATRSAPVLQGYLFDVLQSHDRSVAEAVLERLDCTDDVVPLSSAIRYVEQVADPLYMDAVLRLTHHPVPHVRAAAARAAAVFPHARSTEALLQRLDDGEPEVREAVCESLGVIGATDAAEPIKTRLSDANWQVRLAACVALRRIGVVGVQILRDEGQAVDGTSDVRLVRYVLSLESDALMEHSFSVGMA
jgi:HEAT repeat protein